MQQENMRSAHKNTAYAAWVCSLILSLLSVREYGIASTEEISAQFKEINNMATGLCE